jgi:hypothetical protein
MALGHVLMSMPRALRLHVHTHRTLRGLRAGTVTVHEGGVLWLRGRLVGDVHIETGGRVHLYGRVEGDVINEGVLVLDGAVTGRVTPGGGRTLTT